MAGIASRRKAEELIHDGKVKVNGNVVTDLATKVFPQKDRVVLGNKTVSAEEHRVYLVLNKPKDYITTAYDERGRKTVFDLVRTRERIFPVGRLDRNTTGVLLFTNDGVLASCLMHPSHRITKTYRVTLETGIEEKHAAKIERGVYLDDGKTAAARLEILSGTKRRGVLLTIHEGRNRQVRRMFESLGYEVKHLERVEYGGITVQGVKRGGWRFLTGREVSSLQQQAGIEL
ncbi:MAG: rRNA pseudouridine synthase [Bacteroidota bacterium]|nr:rRNA pseudouridine synthase [Bacteroidota bacterium]